MPTPDSPGQDGEIPELRVEGCLPSCIRLVGVKVVRRVCRQMVLMTTVILRTALIGGQASSGLFKAKLD